MTLTKWEYRLAHSKATTVDETWINAQGAEGWELVALSQWPGVTNMIFKRPLPDPDADGWIEWNPLVELPVPYDKFVNVKKRNGDYQIGLAGSFRWSRTGSLHDIVAYKVG